MSSQFVSTALPEAVGVIWKTVFLSTLQITFGHMVPCRVTLPARCYPPAASAHRRSFVQNRSSPTQNLFHSFLFFQPNKPVQIGCGSKNKEELFYAVRGKIPDSQFEF